MDYQNLRSNRKNHTSVNLLTGYISDSGRNTTASVALQSSYAGMHSGSGNYYVSLDSMFTPITIVNRGGQEVYNYQSPKMFTSGIPSNLYVGNQGVRTENIIPYPGIFHDDGGPSLFNRLGDVFIDGTDVINTLGLKLPIMGAGYGYDIHGEFVPSGDNQMSAWKVGPIDFRWDEQRRVWNAGSLNILKTVVVSPDKFVAIPPNYTDQSTINQIIRQVHPDSGINRDSVLGLEYTTLCSGEIIYIAEVTSPAGYYFALTKPLRGIRVVTGIECVDDVLYLQYNYIASPFISNGYRIVNNSGQIEMIRTGNPCEDLNSNPLLIGLPING